MSAEPSDREHERLAFYTSEGYIISILACSSIEYYYI